MNKNEQYNESIETIISNPDLTPQEKKGALNHLKSLLKGKQTFSAPTHQNTELFHMVNDDSSQEVKRTNTQEIQKTGKVMIKVNDNMKKAGMSSPLIILVSTIMFGTAVILLGILIGSMI